MEKKYRIKEEVKKYFSNGYHDISLTLIEWQIFNVELEALEEEETRVELNINEDYKHLLHKKSAVDFSDEEKDLCEKALNGELFELKNIINLCEAIVCNQRDYLQDNIQFITEHLKQKK